MIKKVLLTLLVLIILLLIGVTSLFLFIDPNNFRGFISETVKNKTGYELTIDGDLRWHIWPQISILSGAVRLEDSGAKKPLLTADNMRLDLDLFSLFSKELSIKNVLVNSAAINITDESQGQVAKTAPTTAQLPTTNSTPVKKDETTAGSDWTFTLNKLVITDSTILWQQSEQDIISVRNINLSIYQQDKYNVEIDFSGAINRDQRNFVYDLNAHVNLQQFPNSALVSLNKFNYRLDGTDIPAGGLSGNLTGDFNYSKSPLTVDSKNFVFTANNNKLVGELKTIINEKPYVEAILSSKKLDLTPFISLSESDESNSDKLVTNKTAPTKPTISKGNELTFLQEFDGKFKLNIDEVLLNKLVFSSVDMDFANKSGVATLNKLNLNIAKGNISAKGTANGKTSAAQVKLDTKMTNIDLGILFGQLNITQHFSGLFNADGEIKTNTLDTAQLIEALEGDLNVVVNNARLKNFNIEQIIQAAAAQYSKDVVTPELRQKYTEFEELSANAKLAGGKLTLTSITADSQTINVDGQGQVGLINEDMDINLNVKLLSGWNGKSETIAKLQNIAIPIRIYGSFTELHYQLNIEKIFRDQLRNQLIEQLIDPLSDKIRGELNRIKDQL